MEVVSPSNILSIVWDFPRINRLMLAYGLDGLDLANHIKRRQPGAQRKLLIDVEQDLPMFEEAAFARFKAKKPRKAEPWVAPS